MINKLFSLEWYWIVLIIYSVCGLLTVIATLPRILYNKRMLDQQVEGKSIYGTGRLTLIVIIEVFIFWWATLHDMIVYRLQKD